MKIILMLLLALLTSCSHQQSHSKSNSVQFDNDTATQVKKYDQYTIDERLDNVVYRVNSLERGIYLIQKAVRDAKDWDEDKKKSVCIAAGKTVRHENIDSMKAIIHSLSDETADMSDDQQSAYFEFRRRIWAIKPGVPLC